MRWPDRTLEELLRAPTEGYGEAIVLPEINGLLRQCPHHGFSELHQLDTFYNSLNTNDQDALDSAAGGNFLDKMPRDGLAIIESKSKVRYSRSRPNDSRAITNAPSSTSSPSNNSFEIQQMAALLEDKMNIRMSRLEKAISEKNATTPATVKAVEEVCVTCGSNHNFNNCPLTRNDFPIWNLQYQITSMKGELKNEIQNTIKNQQTALMSQNNAFQNTLQNNLQNMLSSFFQTQASPSGTLPSNTIPNPKGEIKAITTRSGVAYEGPSNPTKPSPKKVVERETKVITDEEQLNFQGSTAQIPPPVIPKPIPEPEIPKTVPKPNIPYPSRRDNQKNREKASYQKERIFSRCFHDLRFDISFAVALIAQRCLLKSFQKSRSIELSLPGTLPTRQDFSVSGRSITYPKGLAEDVYFKVGKFHFLADFVVVDFEADPRVPLILGRSFLKTVRTVIDVYEGEITLRVDNEAVTFNLDQTMKYSSTDDKCDHDDCDPEEDIYVLEQLLNDDTFQLPLMDLKQSEVTEAKSSIEEPLELELKDLPSHLEYAYLEENDKLPVIIAKGLKNDKKKLSLMFLNLINVPLLGK
ncbi:reverse transcriptase domain-containing protein [Tanacetum coccineum]|uniref:Reverse transcriptase domain-containing protein n=1 Tax=Tanacetum coccineum TaxID=301880 RepID=A0ABQ5H9P7_9ASTR